MTAPYAAVPNLVDNWPSVQGSFGHPYPPHWQTYPLNANFQGHPTSLPQYDFATGNQGALLPYRTAAPILGSSETSVEPRRATPVSRKRSRRNSTEPSRVVEASVETADQFNDWHAGQSLF